MSAVFDTGLQFLQPFQVNRFEGVQPTEPIFDLGDYVRLVFPQAALVRPQSGIQVVGLQLL